MAAYGKPSIMVVDDDKDDLEVTVRGLVRAGYKVHKFSDPLMALEHIEHDGCKDCNLLLSDVHMPSMNGFQLVRRIKELRPSMKIVLMTGFEMHKHEFGTVFPSTHVDRLIRKPFDLTELTIRIGETCKEIDRADQAKKAALPNG